MKVVCLSGPKGEVGRQGIKGERGRDGRDGANASPSDLMSDDNLGKILNSTMTATIQAIQKSNIIYFDIIL